MYYAATLGQTTAVDGISLDISAGEVFGLLGLGRSVDVDRVGHGALRARGVRYTRRMQEQPDGTHDHGHEHGHRHEREHPHDYEHRHGQGHRHDHDHAHGGTPSPIEDNAGNEAVIDAVERTPEDKRVDELLNAITVDLPELTEAVEQQEAPDAAETLEQIGEEKAFQVIEEMETESAADALAHMHPSLAVSVLEDLIEEDPAYAGQLIEEMAPDDATDLLQYLGDDSRDRLLGTLGKVEAVKFRRLLEYPERSAGGMMTTDYLAVRDSMTVREAIEAIRRAEALGEDWLYVFVVDWRGRLQGRATMRALLLANPAQKVVEISEKRVDAVKPDVGRDEVAREFEKYDYLVLPVVDHDDRMLGVITVDDVVDAIRQEGTEDAQAMVGAGRGEAVFSSVADKFRGRLPWLVVNLFTCSISAVIILQFNEVIGTIAMLASLMPVIANQAGTAGQQSLAVTMRGIVLNEVRDGASPGILRREAMVGVLNGSMCGLIVAIVVIVGELIAHPGTNLWLLGIVAGVAMACALSVGTFVGAGLPLLARRVGADPATAATIFLTTITDAVSFLMFLGLATILTRWLQLGH